MPIIVQKYGGSSVADVAKIREVAGRIAELHSDGNELVIVVSAMGNTTTELIHLAKEVSPQPDPREMDMLISVGERIAMSLLSMALKDLGVAARSMTGSQSGIITDGVHSNARVVEVRPDRVRTELAAGNVVIVAGFQGVSRQREITTLGRGGSDTTAVVLAAALGAEYCEICSDVDGVWSADPRVVGDAQKQDSMSLNEALSLARGGAKVLFEDAVRFARDNQVEIRATQSFGPGSGTRLQPNTTQKTEQVTVSGDDQVVRFLSADLADTKTASTVLSSGLRFRRTLGEWIYADTRNVHMGRDTLQTLIPSLSATSMVQAVASGIGEQWPRVAALTEALSQNGFEIRFQGSEGDVVWWEVDPMDLDAAVRCVHRHANS